MKLAAREWSKMRETMDKMREDGARERLERGRERERERERERDLLQLLYRLTAKIDGQESILQREMPVPTRQNGDRRERVSSSFARAMEHTSTNKRQIEVSASIVAARPHSPLVCLDPGNTYLDSVNSPTPLWQEYPAGAALAGTGRGEGGGGWRAASLPASTAGRLRVGHA